MNALLTRQLTMIVRSARVRRYHTEDTQQQQNVGEHTYGVMWLVYVLTNGACSKDLLLAAMMHDAPEYTTGDVPAPVKKQYGVKPVFDAMEDELFESLHIPQPVISDTEARTLKLADCLEGALFCLSEAYRGNRLIEGCLTNYISYLDSMNPTDVALEILNHIKEQRDAIFRQ